MSHPGSSRHLALLMLVMLFGVHLPHAPLVAAQGGLAATPPAITVTLPFGQQTTQTLTISNNTAAAIAPLVYEAQPDQPQINREPERGPQVAALPQQAQRLDVQLVQQFRAAPDSTAEFLVFLEQADLGAAYGIADWASRGQYVYDTLTAWASQQQTGVRALLRARGLAFEPLWISNALLVRGTLADAQALSARADVALVRANRLIASPNRLPLAQASDPRCSPDDPTNPICWNIRKVGADRVWREFGVTGQGVVVANIDTGVNGVHPALAAQYRGNTATSVSHDYNWFDPQGVFAAPSDTGSHGTHTIGTMVAAGGNGRPAVGVAPGAQWIAAQGCETSTCSESDLIRSAQWLLAPTRVDGTQPRPDLRPMIVNNSWSGPGNDNTYAGYTAAWRAAGIFPVFAAGNAGINFPQVCGSIHSPADYPDVVAVGATDLQDRITSFSLIGPAIDGRLKPDLVAPGSSLLSTVPGGAGYQTLQGTSMAAPHVAGVVALLWSANPRLIGDYDATYRILTSSARQTTDVRCGDAAGGPNNVYGYGRLDAYAAVAQAQVDLPWLAVAAAPVIPVGGGADLAVTIDTRTLTAPGTYTARLLVYDGSLGNAPTVIPLTLNVVAPAQAVQVAGTITSATSGLPVQATVAVKDGPVTRADVNGQYRLALPPARYELTASAPGFRPAQQTITVTGDLPINITLTPDQPQFVLATNTISTSVAFGQPVTVTIPISNTGSQPLFYQVSVQPVPYGVWRSDETGGPTYAWVDLPPDAATLTLPDNGYEAVPLGFSFRILNQTYNRVLVTSDGTLAFETPTRYDGPANVCLPDDDVRGLLVAPFRTDLDPSQGGRVRYATLNDGQLFVVSYEDVALRDGSARVSVQALLHADGRVGFQYRTVAPIQKLSVGIQRNGSEVLQIGCGGNTPIRDGLALELRPQLASRLWLVHDTDVQTLLPGATAHLSLTVQWVVMPIPQPLRGVVQLRSNDSARLQQDIAVQVVPQREPHRYWLPRVSRS